MGIWWWLCTMTEFLFILERRGFLPYFTQQLILLFFLLMGYWPIFFILIGFLNGLPQGVALMALPTNHDENPWWAGIQPVFAVLGSSYLACFSLFQLYLSISVLLLNDAGESMLLFFSICWANWFITWIKTSNCNYIS